MDYGEGVQKVLLRKIQKAEQDLTQLKLDYCRFVFGLTHRTRVVADGKAWLVRNVDVESMTRLEDGTFSKPAIAGVEADAPESSELVELGTEWALQEQVAGTAH